MSFTVTGFTDGVPYSAAVGDAGLTSASPRIRELLEFHIGEQFGVTPTHSKRALSLDDPASIHAALHTLTNVSAVEGENPDDDDTDPSEKVIQ